jgi:hypothetical protein
VREADNLTTFTCRMSWKSGSLNLLEPSGPHRACYGTPLPLNKEIVIFFFVTLCVRVLVRFFDLVDGVRRFTGNAANSATSQPGERHMTITNLDCRF